MFLVVRLIDTKQPKMPNGEFMEYDISVNSDSIWYLRPNLDPRTCTVVYTNNAEHVVRHPVAELQSKLSSLGHAEVATNLYVAPPIVKEETEVKEKKGPFGRPLAKGTTSAALE